MRHLYAASTEPGVSYLIDKAKTYERRRCGHLPADYPEPLSTRECLSSVVDPKGNKTNKHRYVAASQDLETRKAMRAIAGVPLYQSKHYDYGANGRKYECAKSERGEREI